MDKQTGPRRFLTNARPEHTEAAGKILSGFRDGVVAAGGQDGRILYSNPAAAGILRRSVESIPLEEWPAYYGFYLPDGRTACPASDFPLSCALEGKHVDDVELLLRRSDLAETVRLSLSAWPLAHGRAVLHLRDVTRQHETETRSRSEHAMSTASSLAGGLAHDLNNLLMVIAGYTELLGGSASPEQRSALEEITRATNRAATLTSQLLSFSGRHLTRPELLSVNDLVQSFGQQLLEEFPENIRICTALASELGWIYADPGHLQQALRNLTLHARERMPGGGRLTLTTANTEVPADSAISEGSYVRVSVADTGAELEEDQLRRLFEPYFVRLSPWGDSGLALSTAFGIIKQAGGHFHAACYQGRGLEVQIYLPVAASAERREPIPIRPASHPAATSRTNPGTR